jgi:hypothetical protein
MTQTPAVKEKSATRASGGRRGAPGAAGAKHPIQGLHDVIGNSAMQRVMAPVTASAPAAAIVDGTRGQVSTSAPGGPDGFPRPIQKKLAIGTVDDPLERDADRAAARVMNTPVPLASLLAGGNEPVWRKFINDPAANHAGECRECENEVSRIVRRKEAGSDGPSEAPGIVQDVLRSSGHPLDAQTRAFFEPRFGRDFSSVRVHTDAAAAKSAESINALAYTSGDQLVFGRGQYPAAGRSQSTLLAHELAHVVQQQGGQSAAANGAVGLSACSSRQPLIARQTIDVDVENGDPMTWTDYIDKKMTAIAYSIYTPLLVFVEGMSQPIAIPLEYVQFGNAKYASASDTVYANRDAAVQSIPVTAPTAEEELPFAYFRVVVGGMVAPTIFSPATAPRIVRTAADVIQRLKNEVQSELTFTALTLVGATAFSVAFRGVVELVDSSAARSSRSVAETAAQEGALARGNQGAAEGKAPSLDVPVAPRPATTRAEVEAMLAKVRSQQVRIVYNVGGRAAAGEPPNAINIQPEELRGGIPNQVRVRGEEMDTLLPPDSGDEVYSRNLVGNIDWTKMARAAKIVVKPGGTVMLRPWAGQFSELPQIEAAMRKAGFKNVRIESGSAVKGER